MNTCRCRQCRRSIAVRRIAQMRPGGGNFKTARKRDPRGRAFAEAAPTWCSYSIFRTPPQAKLRVDRPVPDLTMEFDHDPHTHRRRGCIAVRGDPDAEFGARPVL